MSTRAEIECYLAEGAGLIRQAEECASRLAKVGACEGQRLMAAQIIKAMQRLMWSMEQHRTSLERVPISWKHKRHLRSRQP
ncbi:hypothetical protein [Methylobacterium oxalidis]|uniref:hypothetical protein n=1 Tax=Methylobacterium oxalidis TaxID=944322 RepID=UPI0033161B7E